ncbi:MAG TPA: hypothetical protein VJ907_04420 [Halanaerobiales bacterium]|nr:hypothetical protein [Halanaerobiales bacterium]
MDAFLLVIFIIVGIAGLIFKVEAGAFVGLSLAPWQIIKLDLGEKISLYAIIFSTIIGSIYLISISRWLLFLLFLLVEAYNYWGYKKRYSK